MTTRPDLLAALVPRPARRPLPGDDEFGAIALLALAGKGLAAGLSFIASGKGKKYLAALRKRKESHEQRAKRYRRKYERSRDPAAKARWKRRWKRSQAKADDMALTKQLAESGVVGERPVLQYKRNLLALEWEDADTTPERKKQIEDRVMSMDKRLKILARRAKALASVTAPEEAAPAAAPAAPAAAVKGSGTRGPVVRVKRVTRDPLVGDAGTRRWRNRIARNARRGRGIADKVDRAMVSGLGGLDFDVMSPPGPGRLARLPFYPEVDAQSWAGANGIEFPGDDPTLLLPFNFGVRAIGPFRMVTERFDYGSYRILGIQTNEQGTAPTTDSPGVPPPGLGDIAITVQALSLYNGQELFLQDRLQEIPASTFSILPSWRTAAGLAGGLFTELPYNYVRRRSRFFTGLRDYPVVSGTADVQILVRAFTTLANPGPGAIQVPFTCNLVVEMVEDKVYGDPAIPNPAARAGAMVKVAAREPGGVAIDGRSRQAELVTSRYRPPLLEG